MNLALVLAVVSVGLSAIVQILVDRRISRAFIAHSALAFAVFALHCALGLAVMTWLLPHGPGAALGTTIALIGWIGLGFLGLVRLAPRLEQPPAILTRLGPADLVCLALIAGGIAAVSGWRP